MMLVTLDNGETFRFPSGPVCLECKHTCCPCCPGWCDELAWDVDGLSFELCCGGQCVFSESTEEWQAALVEAAEPHRIVSTEWA